MREWGTATECKRKTEWYFIHGGCTRDHRVLNCVKNWGGWKMFYYKKIKGRELSKFSNHGYLVNKVD